MTSNSAEPSKSNASWNETVGVRYLHLWMGRAKALQAGKEYLGEGMPYQQLTHRLDYIPATGMSGLAQDGKEQKLSGQTERKAAEAQGYAVCNILADKCDSRFL